MKSLIFQYSLILCLLNSFASYSQQPEHKKKKYIDSIGRYYQQASLPLYFYVSTSPDESPTQLLVNDKPKPIYLEGHGVHGIKHHNVITNEIETFDVYADGITPITKSFFSGAPFYSTPSMRYYGKGLSISLDFKDEMSGVEATYISRNGDAFKKYTKTQVTEEGKQTLNYYSVDNVGNVEKVKTETFTVDISAPNTFHNIVGISTENVISTGSTIYLTVEDNLAGVAVTSYHFDGEKAKVYTGGNIPFQYLIDGNHTLYYNSIDNVKNIEVEKSVAFYLDKTAPIMSADVLGDKFLVGEKVYFSGRTKLKLTAVDNKSGIKDVFYSINKGSFVKYKDAFYLPNRSGLHSVDYYAVDNTQNKSIDNFQHSVGVIYVDLTGPALSHRFEGPTFLKDDTVYINPITKLVLTSNDPESGLQYISYKTESDQREVTYKAPLSISSAGKHTIDYFGYDNVNNRNAKSVTFMVDDLGPFITTQFSVAPINESKYPSYVNIFLAGTDQLVGTKKISYILNDGKETDYTGSIKGFQKEKHYILKIIAVDLLGNQSIKEVKFDTGKY